MARRSWLTVLAECTETMRHLRRLIEADQQGSDAYRIAVDHLVQLQTIRKSLVMIPERRG